MLWRTVLSYQINDWEITPPPSFQAYVLVDYIGVFFNTLGGLMTAIVTFILGLSKVCFLVTSDSWTILDSWSLMVSTQANSCSSSSDSREWTLPRHLPLHQTMLLLPSMLGSKYVWRSFADIILSLSHITMETKEMTDPSVMAVVTLHHRYTHPAVIALTAVLFRGLHISLHCCRHLLLSSFFTKEPIIPPAINPFRSPSSSRCLPGLLIFNTLKFFLISTYHI